MVALQNVILWGIICWLAYLILRRVDLKPFLLTHLLKQVIYPGALFGILTGFCILFLNMWQNAPPPISHPPLWASALAALYGGINEEVLSRLFLLTLIYFLFTKLFRKTHERKRSYLLLSAVILTAILFGALHLPLAFQLGMSSPFDIFRIFLLNGVGGLVFGWLYCTKGFWTAAVAHSIADIVIHVVLI
jgi:hypothetical protein